MERIWSILTAVLAAAAAGGVSLVYHWKRFSVLPKNRKMPALLSCAVCAVSGLLLSLYGSPAFETAKLVFLMESLLWLSVIDRERRILPNGLILILAAARAVFFIPELRNAAGEWQKILIDAAVGAAAAGGLFLVVRLITKKSLGMGDVKLISVVGAYLGLSGVLTAVFAASLFAAVFGIVLRLRKKDDADREMSFGPFIAAGAGLVILLGF